MSKQAKYPGIAAGSYGEQAIDIVADVKSISGPSLAARLGISVYEMGVVRRAVQLGYLKKDRSPEQSTVNIFTAGHKMPDQTSDALAKPGKSRPHILLEHIAKRERITSVDLAALMEITPGEVSSCLSYYVERGFVKVRSVPSQGENGTKSVNEFYGANLVAYLENCVRGGRRNHVDTWMEDAEPKEALNIVPPRTPFAFRPLNLARLGTPPMREGAWDFKKIPSRFTEAEAGSDA